MNNDNKLNGTDLPTSLKDEWEVYIILTQSGKFYTGITKNLERRFKQHKDRQKGARFFNTSTPEKIVFRERHLNRSEATKREIAIKKLSRKDKENLILMNNE